MTTSVPTEDVEHKNFVVWLAENNIPFWHTNNEWYSKSWKQKKRSKEMGAKSGIPDLFICLDGKLVGIEMKRQKGGVVSPSQRYWGYILEHAGVECFVCRGRDHAVETVEYLLKTNKKMPVETIKEAERFIKIKENPRKSPKNDKNSCPF